MGLVSCLDQLDLLVFCVQRNSVFSHELLWINLFVMMVLLAALVTKRVSCSTLPLWRPLSLGPLTLSLFVGASSQALCVSAHSTRHMLGFPPTLASSSGAHSQPQSTTSRSSTQASHFILQGTPTFGFPLSNSVLHDRLTHLFCPLCKRSCSFIHWFFGLPTDRCGAALDIILSSPSLSTPITVHSGLNCCPLAPLCCPLLSSDHMLCFCRLDIPRALLSPSSAYFPCPVCTTGPLWLLLAITISPLGSSPWPTSLALSLRFLSVHKFWTLFLTFSRGSSVSVLQITLVVAPGPAHAEGSLYGGMMRATTSWLFATAHGVTFAAPGLLRISLVSTSSINSFTTQFVPPGPVSGTSGLVL